MFQFSILKFYFSFQLNLWRVQPAMNNAGSMAWKSIKRRNLSFTQKERGGECIWTVLEKVEV